MQKIYVQYIQKYGGNILLITLKSPFNNPLLTFRSQLNNPLLKLRLKQNDNIYTMHKYIKIKPDWCKSILNLTHKKKANKISIGVKKYLYCVFCISCSRTENDKNSETK